MEEKTHPTFPKLLLLLLLKPRVSDKINHELSHCAVNFEHSNRALVSFRRSRVRRAVSFWHSTFAQLDLDIRVMQLEFTQLVFGIRISRLVSLRNVVGHLVIGLIHLNMLVDQTSDSFMGSCIRIHSVL